MALHPSVSAALASLLGRPCWRARTGHGSFLTFELGPPIVTTLPALPAIGDRPARPPRDVIHGEWHLWVQTCCWSLEERWRDLADERSPSGQVEPHLRRVEGRALRDVTIDASNSDTLLVFDGDDALVLETWAAPDVEPAVVHWSLFLPGGDVLTVRGGGEFSLGSAMSTEKTWLPLASAR